MLEGRATVTNAPPRPTCAARENVIHRRVPAVHSFLLPVGGAALETDQRLSSVLSEFARTLATDSPIQAILDHLVVRIVDLLPISAAGVTLISPGSGPHYIAASDASALRYEQLQSDLAEGPCLAAFATGEPVTIPDLQEDHRFPRFAEQAVEEGLLAVFTFPLHHGDERLGALDLYRGTPGRLSSGSMAAAQTLSDVAAAYLLNARARELLHESTHRAQFTSMHDALTGLPNRTLLLQRLDHAIRRSRRSEKQVAILFADLDRFKSVNDTYGHHVGDELLVAVAERLTALLRPGDTLARLAGDEFVIMCEDLDDATQADHIATRVTDALADAFVLSTTAVQVSASVGIAFAGPPDSMPDKVLRDADAAMYQAKRKGGGRHGVVDLREQGLATQRASLSRDLLEALAKGELRTAYQPIVATAGGKVAGAEALLRWAHPTWGTMHPAAIVPLAEQSGLISDVGRWVLRSACRDQQRWQHQGAESVGIGVNVSPHQLMERDFVEGVEAVLTGIGTDPSRVTIDVTESAFIQDSERALVVLQDLKDLGVLLALDDFGTGYSSLNHLKRFPIDIVKIDRSLIAELGRDPTSRHIVRTLVQLVHALGMRAVAEGVESFEQHEEVLALGCDAYQGFYCAAPISSDQMAALLAGWDDKNAPHSSSSVTLGMSRRQPPGAPPPQRRHL